MRTKFNRRGANTELCIAQIVQQHREKTQKKNNKHILKVFLLNRKNIKKLYKHTPIVEFVSLLLDKRTCV